mmetsp:Transcript_14538/g.39846  ORF Transcript_14538/g.39846 Transcript_14538/m.39846 type:complete len:200 (-) Transcript_14538:1084-1683(-)
MGPSTDSVDPTNPSRVRIALTVASVGAAPGAYLWESSVSGTSLLASHAVASASNSRARPPPFLPAARDFSCASLKASSKPALSHFIAFSSHMISTRSTGNPKDSHRRKASAPETVSRPSSLALAAIFLNCSTPLSSVRPKDSSSSAMISVTRFSSLTISGKTSPNSSTTVLTSVAKKPCLAPSFSRPNRTARLSTRRST